MAESNPDPSSPGDGVKSPRERSHPHHKETHGLSGDIDVDTLVGDVKAPNVFERAKEEIEAIVDAIHHRKESRDSDLQSCGETRDSSTKDPLKTEWHSENNAASLDIKAKEHKPHHHKETHGMSSDFDENTPISEFKGPNVFERAKEEIEALVHTIQHKKDSEESGSSGHKSPITGFKSPNVFERAKEEFEALIHTINPKKDSEESESHGHKSHHHKETHGMSSDFDENTPISEFKGPNVFERAKEEIEAFIHTIHPKDSD